jgi:predicted membrane protein
VLSKLKNGYPDSLLPRVKWRAMWRRWQILDTPLVTERKAAKITLLVTRFHIASLWLTLDFKPISA